MKFRLGGYTYLINNFFEFLTIYKDIFIHNEYEFTPGTKTPNIIDCGAHIGLSVLYFKKHFPKATITAFEPNPGTFQLLKENVANNRLSGVRLVNKAVSDRNAALDFYIAKGKSGAWSCGDSAAPNPWITKETHQKIIVPAVKLSAYITKEVDLLKLDVEGMEARVLTEIQPKLGKVRSIIMEYHGNKANNSNRFARIRSIFNSNGFRYRVHHPYSILKPIRNEVPPKHVDSMENSFLVVYATKAG